jgi:hypothetical protein
MGWAAGSGSQSRQETATCKGPPGWSSTAARATISGRCREESRYWCTVRMGQRLSTATPTWTRTWSGRWAAGVATPATAPRRRHACRAAQRAGAPGPSWLCPRPPAGQRCLAGHPGGWTGSHGRAHARHHRSTTTGSRVIPRRWVGCRLLVPAHLLQRRELLSGRLPTGNHRRRRRAQDRADAAQDGGRAGGAWGCRCAAGRGCRQGSTIADAVMPYAEQKARTRRRTKARS